MQNYQLLDWDTEILGIKTAKIIPEKLTETQLTEILFELKQQDVRLVFWCSDSDDQITQHAAEKHQAFLADEKVTYLMDLTNFVEQNIDISDVVAYENNIADDQLKKLALFVGLNSRFGLDPKITLDRCKKVYETWLDNSVKKNIAKEVLVIRRDNKIVGFVTLGEKNGRGDIGLIAVDENYRGQQLATKLVYAAQLWCKQQGYKTAQVVTQKTNVAACKLYEKNGYHLEKVENFYHLWL